MNRRTFRGGSWRFITEDCTSDSLVFVPRLMREVDLSFRVCL